MTATWLLSQFLRRPKLIGRFVVGELFMASLAWDAIRSRGKKSKELFAWIAIPLVLMSLTRSANRYLLAVLVPMSLYMSLMSYRMYSMTKSRLVPLVLALHAVMFSAVGFYSNYYLHLRGLAG